jgi:hypothetical protein
MENNRYLSILLFASLLLLACLIASVVIFLPLKGSPPEPTAEAGLDSPGQVATQHRPAAEPTPTAEKGQASVPTSDAKPSLTATPASARDSAPAATPPPSTGDSPPPTNPPPTSNPMISTEDVLANTEIPVRDRLDLARRFKLSDQPILAVVNPTPPAYQVGDQESFWVSESETLRQFQVPAILRYVGPHSYWWIEDGYNVSDSEVAASGEVFENSIYPTNRAFFGSEWSPGVDNDPRVHIFIGDVPGVGGYFYSINEYSKLINPFSNEKEMFFININAARPGSDRLDSILAHEFQHMIHWYNDANEETWVNEGLSELAMYLNGYDTGGTEGAYLRTPDTQLNAWGDSPNESFAHYGGSFLFMNYFLERFGEDNMRRVVAHPANGADGFDAVLAAEASPYRFDDIYADWLIANYLVDPALGEGLWGYRDLSVNPVTLDARHDDYPVQRDTTVSQYAADYIGLESRKGSLIIEFVGETQVKAVPNQPHSGVYQWWSNRGDDSDMTLTRNFDLSDVDQATLQFWTWYDIEGDWDFAYVEVSTDGGQTWDILPGLHTTTENKSGNSFGHAWTGISGGGDTPEWIQEEIDLSAYAGQVIDVRFEYITDDAVNHVGFLIDDLAVSSIGYVEDVEAGDGGWQANGFVRMDNVLPQRYVVQVIELGDEPRVQRMILDENNHGRLTVEDLGSKSDGVILVISGTTPFTTEPATYTYSVSLTQ